MNRRAPWAKPPVDLLANGYAADLDLEVRKAAERLGAPVSYIRKNGDCYIAVRIPNKEELVAIDAATSEAPTQPTGL
jgi:hypothetical protein